MIMKKWFAVYTRPKWERKVAQSLSTKNVENYCPLNAVEKQWSDRKKIIMQPLFTSYVFVHAADVEHAVIKQSDGVVNFVYWLGKPAEIREDEIRMIKQFLNEYKNVSVEKINVNVQDKIRITNGPLSGLEGNVVELRSRTVKVTLPSLGYQLLAEVGRENITIINKVGIPHHLAS
jgi:transcription antitermination factor NusG